MMSYVRFRHITLFRNYFIFKLVDILTQVQLLIIWKSSF